MGRAILGVVVGYLSMFVVVFAGLTVGFLVLGTERTFKPATYEVSGAWIAVWFVVSLVSAVLGGFVCAAIAKRPKPAYVLAVVVLVLGALSAVMAGNKPDPGPRLGNVSNTDAMMKAKQPVWMAWATPVIGAVGVIAGAGLRKPKIPAPM